MRKSVVLRVSLVLGCLWAAGAVVPSIFATQAFQSPTRPGVQFHDIFTIFLDKVNGSGGILSVINGVGGPSTAANADTPVDVISYP